MGGPRDQESECDFDRIDHELVFIGGAADRGRCMLLQPYPGANSPRPPPMGRPAAPPLTARVGSDSAAKSVEGHESLELWCRRNFVAACNMRSLLLLFVIIEVCGGGGA
mmetsp:Transcript_52838/g.126187  ORF Transcript_52838/g.126187 Transcript_52838/m.126187 type:complete len:109 (-) Transcript_52838:1629-1955(-)